MRKIRYVIGEIASTPDVMEEERGELGRGCGMGEWAAGTLSDTIPRPRAMPRSALLKQR